MPRLKNWSVAYPDRYASPEAQIPILQGEVYEHPNHEDGTYIGTSYIVLVKGSIVQTQNSIYILEDPDPEFVEWCEEQGCHVPTKEEPIKIVSKDET